MKHDTPAMRRVYSRRAVIRGAAVGAAAAALAYGLDKAGLVGSQDPGLPEPDAARLSYRIHPGSGDAVSLLGFGCMRFPMSPEAAGPHGPQIDEAAAFRLVDYALAHGVNFFDTAYPYHQGVSEEVIGKALKRRPRDSFFLADKMPGYRNPTLDEAEKIFETQLARCQVDYFDYYLLHNLSNVEHYRKIYESNGVVDYLLEMKRVGRIRNLGWSFHGDMPMLEYLLSRDLHWDFAMVQFNYHDLLNNVPSLISQMRVAEPAPPQWLLETLVRTGIPLIIMEPLLGGRLARLNKKALTILQEEKPQASAASWAFRYVAALPNVLTVLSGMTYMEHLQDNLRTYSPFTPLSERETVALGRALNIFITQENIPCTACYYCMPCPYGVEIPAVFTHYNHCVDDEYIPKGARNADYEKARRAFLVGHDRSVPELRQAIRCTGCGICVPLCPQRINIPEQMSRLGKFVEGLRSEV
ncbi:MAG: aldo/keto reductase [Desulfovibrio sp.]|jgi:predicted aldo/keto reductase-like oxidoreductase|nr:aldo/keto reductase [Desulfovibrio sp.]